MSKLFVIRISISVGAALAGGFVSNYFLNIDSNQSFIIGLLIFIATEMFFILLEMEATRSGNHAISLLSQAFPQGGQFSNYYTALILSKIRSKTLEATKIGIEIPKEEVPRVWTECVGHFETSLRATTYVAHKFWWNKSYADQNVIMRKAQAQQGKRVTILFLWDTEDELEVFSNFVEDQRIAGIKVSHAPLKIIKNDKTRSPYLNKIGTIDFALIDDNWVFLHYLDKKRQTLSGKLTNDPLIIDSCREFLRLTPGEDDFSKSNANKWVEQAR